MMAQLKEIVKSVFHALWQSVSGTRIGQYLMNTIMKIMKERATKISYGGVDLIFSTPNPLCEWRVETFATKEPETLDWIDALLEGSVVWDVGANVGLYSCYAAKKRNCRVFAFEPSVFNLELLARNIFCNDLVRQITMVPLPLSDNLAIGTLNMTSTEWGGALSSFGQSYGHDGKTMQRVFEFSTVGITMVDAVELLKIPQPDYIKMDVDGIEHLILGSGRSVLLGVKSVLVEINDEFTEQYNGAAECLRAAGLVLFEKKHSLEVAQNREFMSSFNQIWFRPAAVNQFE